MGVRRLAFAFVGLILAVSADVSAAPTAHHDVAIALGEVSSAVEREDVDLGGMLRALVEQELPGVDVGRPRPKPSILSLSLVEMQRTPTGANKSAVSVVVSATLRDKKRGAVIAVLEGRARAENEERLAPLLERAAMKSALRGALDRLPEALDPLR